MSKKSRKSRNPARAPSGLAPAFPSAPTRIGAFVLYIKRDGQFVSAQNFCAEYSAQKFLDLLIEGEEIKLETDTLIKAGKLTIKCSQLKKIRDHELTATEAEWELPVPFPNTAMRIKLGETFEPPEPPPLSEPSSPSPKSKTPKKERKPRTSRDGLISIAQIAEEMSITSREARGILRKREFPKPEAGWAWTEGLEVNQVKTALAKG